MIHAARRLMCDKFSILCTLAELNARQTKEDEEMYKPISEESLLRNNSLVIFASKIEGADFSQMDAHHYREGLIEDLREEGYVIFFAFAGLFVIDDLVTTSTKHVQCDLDDYITFEEAVKRTKLVKDQRRF